MKANMAASVRQRLLNRSREEKRPFAELLQYYGMERFLYRLGCSTYRDRFILKGALMLRVWQSPESRPTMDIDLLGRTVDDPVALLDCIRDIIGLDITDDGLTFDPESLRAEPITREADYQGWRVRFLAHLNNARITMQLDIGYGDVIHPAPQRAVFPVLLDGPAPKLLCYSRESTVAEKLQAMVQLGLLNSRAKDFYDIWLLSRLFAFELKPLQTAIEKTFARRDTELPEEDLFTAEFVTAMERHWKPFHRRLNQAHVPADFNEIAAQLRTFLAPVIDSSALNHKAKWPAAGPWKP